MMLCLLFLVGFGLLVFPFLKTIFGTSELDKLIIKQNEESSRIDSQKVYQDMNEYAEWVVRYNKRLKIDFFDTDRCTIVAMQWRNTIFDLTDDEIGYANWVAEGKYQQWLDWACMNRPDLIKDGYQCERDRLLLKIVKDLYVELAPAKLTQCSYQ